MKNRVTEILNIRFPIIQAPMYFLTDATFVAAVSDAGGWELLAQMPGRIPCPSHASMRWNACVSRFVKRSS